MKKQGVFFPALVVLAAAALVVLIVLLFPGNTPDTPEVRLSDASASDAPDGDSTAGGSAALVEVSPETVQTVVAQLTRAGSYSRTLTVRSFWASGSVTTEIRVWARGETVRAEIQEEGRDTVKNVLLRGAEKWIWYSDADGVYQGPARDGDADAYQTIPTYEDVLALDTDDITAAGYEDYNGEGCVYVRYRSGALGYETMCYISLESGLLMGAEIYDADVLVYSMTSSAPVISTPDEALFAMP